MFFIVLRGSFLEYTAKRFKRVEFAFFLFKNKNCNIFLDLFNSVEWIPFENNLKKSKRFIYIKGGY